MEDIEELHERIQEAMGHLDAGNLEEIEQDLAELQEMIDNFPLAENAPGAAPGADAERRRRIRERYEQISNGINDMADDEMAELLQPILDALQEIGEIDGPEFNEVQNLDHYEAELDRIEHMISDLAGNNEHEEIFNGGRFKQSRKKHRRRKQKTLRKLLKKLK
jgi:hypothetical protein